MKQFIVDRHTTPSTPALVQVPTEKLPIYDNVDDAIADLANLSVGQIGSTKDTGSELSAPVDVVEEDNLHAVTSNAVAESLSYSETEQKTGGVWIDGKPIYRKVYYSATNWALYSVVDSDVSYIDTIIKMDNIVINIDGTRVMNFINPNASPIDNCGSYITPNNTLNAIRLGACQSTNPSWIIIEYTKTTD